MNDRSEAMNETTSGGILRPDVFHAVYAEMRRLAREYLRDEPSNHTLQATALAHETFVRMQRHEAAMALDRKQFLIAAARTMRRVLIDYARKRRCAKRLGYVGRIALDDAPEPAARRADHLIALDDALVALDDFDSELARIVELRFFGALTIDEIAELLGVAPITVKRRWKLARGWLEREMNET